MPHPWTHGKNRVSPVKIGGASHNQGCYNLTYFGPHGGISYAADCVRLLFFRGLNANTNTDYSRLVRGNGPSDVTYRTSGALPFDAQKAPRWISKEACPQAKDVQQPCS